MPEAWSDKDERQYEHIKKSSKTRGRSTRRAKEIAAATVNKKRSAEGRTKKAKKKTKKKTKKKSGKKAAKKRASKKTTSRRSTVRRGGTRKKTTKRSSRRG